MAKRKMDDEDSLKRQARRRLIGAVALVTAVVVILPMVLDSQPRMMGQNIDLRIPNPDKVGAFKSQIVLPAEPPAPAGASAPAAAGPASAAAPVATGSKPQPATSKSEPAKAEKSSPAAKPASKPSKKPHVASKSAFAVQIGAYSNAKTVESLKARLIMQGLPVYTEKAGSSVRVRVGPYTTRAAAEKSLHKLEKQGMKPALVSPN